MAIRGHPPEHPSEAGGRSLRKGAGRKGNKERKRYLVTVRSAVPDDLAERISAVHAVAIRHREDRSGSTAREAHS